jgi:hypothetical protein
MKDGRRRRRRRRRVATVRNRVTLERGVIITVSLLH